jgi:cytochrome c nitrite reductase small subunit
VTRWLVGLGILTGLVMGIGGYTFIYAKGSSYLTNDPAACANCHVMSDYYAQWQRSSHRSVAVCNDCHTPKGFVPKYVTKAANGFWHSVAFTTGRFPDPLRIKDHNHEITENACRKCHGPITMSIDQVHTEAAAVDVHYEIGGATLSCTRCHRHVGHWVR